MNILFVFWKMLNPTTGGIERVTDLLCRKFMQRGHRVWYLNSPDDKSPEYDYPASVSLFPRSRKWQEPECPENIDYYNKFLKDKNIDVVIIQDLNYFQDIITHGTPPAGTKVITVLHSNPLYRYKNIYKAALSQCRDWRAVKRLPWELKWAYEKRKKALKKYRTVYADTMAHIDAFCMLSMHYLPELCSVYHGDTGKVIAIPNPNTYEVQDDVCIKHKKKQLLYVGRLDPLQKRVDRVLSLWKRVYKDFEDWDLIIVGDGPQAEELKRMASTLDRVRFAGRQDPAPYYRDASILCLTSDYEGWAMVLPEAMTFGTVPVLFDSYCAAAELVIDNETGMLVKPFSMKQFERRLRLLMSDDTLRRQMSHNGMKHIGQFDIDSIADLWESLFKRLSKRH